jgi:hypothetical protein
MQGVERGVVAAVQPLAGRATSGPGTRPQPVFIRRCICIIAVQLACSLSRLSSALKCRPDGYGNAVASTCQLAAAQHLQAGLPRPLYGSLTLGTP